MRPGGEPFRHGAGSVTAVASEPRTFLARTPSCPVSLLVNLQGNDIRQKYPGVRVAQTGAIKLMGDGTWRRIQIKTDASTTFFVLHDFLREIGFINWAAAPGKKLPFTLHLIFGLSGAVRRTSAYGGEKGVSYRLPDRRLERRSSPGTGIRPPTR
jgi:hypothetical protein